jgi:Ni/Co efflux regulator RcnB
MKTPTLTRTLRTGLIAAALAAAVGGTAIAPAFADGDDWHHDRDRHEQDWRDHDGRRDRDDRAAVYVAPGYYAAPAYGYGYGYAYVPAPSLSLGFTFR